MDFFDPQLSFDSEAIIKRYYKEFVGIALFRSELRIQTIFLFCLINKDILKKQLIDILKKQLI